MQRASLLLILCLGLQTGTVVNAGEPEECALTFYMFGSQQERVVFTGLTAEELARRDTTSTGHKLTCACTTVEGLTPLEWLDESGMELPNNKGGRLVDYKAAGSQPGSAVNLRINKNSFPCAEAGEYTCVVGPYNRTVLVTPIGEECGPANVTVTASPTGPVSIGTDLTLECSAEDPTASVLTYQWLRKGTLISGEVSPTLMVTVMGPQEGGTYTCRVRNRVGQDEASVTVEVIVVTSSTPMVTSSTPVVIMVEPSSTPTEPLPAPGSVRLVDGTGPHEGRVEIFYNNTWGTVCDNDWSINDGLVVCHQLGYPGLLSVYKRAHFGEGTGPILLDNLICTGTEDNLIQCPNGEVNCRHSEDAGVTCARESVSSSSTIVRSSFEEPTASTSALPSTDFMLPSTQDVQSTLTVLAPSTPVIESSPSDVDASTPVVTPSIPVITPSPSDVAPSTPVITSTSSVADSTSAVVTPSSTSTRPSTSPTPGPTVNVQTPTGVIVNTSRVTGGAVQITLMWSKPGNDSGLTGYQIQYSWESKWEPSQVVKRQSERKIMSVTVTDTSYTLKDAEGFAEYCFAVSALYEGGEKSPATAEECTTTPETKPSPPLNLCQVDSSVTTSSVRLQWDAPDPPNGNIKHFKVYYQHEGPPRQYQVSDWQGQGYVVLDGLDPNTEYYVNVTAVTDTLESDGSNGLRVVTLPVTEPSKPVVTPSTPDITAAVADSAAPEVTPSFATVSSSARPSTSPTPSPSVDPQTPMGMTVNHSTTDDEKVDITLMWSKPGNDSGLTGYQIQYRWESKWDPSRFVKRQSERKTMSVNVTNTSHTLKDVEGFAEYCFAVSALYEGGEESPATDEECITTPETKPSPPQNLRQVDSSVTTSSVQLQWDAPDPPNGNITHFKVYYQEGSSRQYRVSDWQGQRYVVLDGLDPDTEYYVNVTAVTDTLESDGSNGLKVLTLPVAALDTPMDMSVNHSTTDDEKVDITLMWSKPGSDSGLTGYQIQYSWESKWDPSRVVKRQSERKTMSVNVTDTSYTLQDAEGFAEYCFAVSALYEGGEKSNAAAKQCNTTPETKPSPPLNLRQVDSSVTTSSVRLQWDAPDRPNANITHFKVYYQEGSSRQYQVRDWQGQGYVVLDRLDPNTEYYVNVTAVTDTFESGTSNGLRVLTLVTVPKTPDDILVIVIIVVVVVIVILIPLIVVASIVLWVLYRRNKKYEAEETSFSMPRYEHIEMKSTKELENGAEGRAGRSGEGVPGAPSLEVGEQYLDVSAGAPTLVYVNAEGSPTPLVLWKQGEEYLDEERYPVLSGGSLYIPETLPTHQGTYTVSATNANGTVNADVRIDVYQQTPPPRSDGSAVSLDGFPECVARLRAKNEEGFNDEYETLDMEEWHMTTHSSRALVNYPKNRYINIVPYDHSRVVLDLLGELPGSDYINATWVNGYTEPRSYIACQGPLPNYIEDFWRMVWQFRIPTIVIVTNLMEGQKIKCHRYYPESGSQVFGMFTVSLKREECLAEYTVRHLVVEGPRDGQPLHVTQFHFTAWPDHGVPQYATGLLSFRNRVNQHHVLHKGSPMVVHCSAGVGRTGTYISVDILLKKIEAEGIVDVFNVVRQLRWHRKYMVQTVSQYVFVYNAVLEAVMCGETCVSVQGLRKRIEELGERVDGQTRFEVEFEKLLATSSEVEFTCDVAARQENVARNRYQTNLPSDTARVVLIGKEEDENDYINASYIDGYYNQRAFLATQGPLESTTSDFWEMVWDQRSVAIVSLTQLVEDGQELCSQYWPSEVGEAKQFGCLTVKLINEDSPCTEYVVRKLRVWQENKQEEGRLVTQFHFLQWPQGGCPDSATPVVELVNDLQRVQRQSGNRPITVQCSDGVGRTGAFCALVTALERVKTEQIVDVFRTVRTHRIQRSGMVANLSQYKFIYDAVVEYLVSFDNYSNFK